ncbi:hypothetical protein SESBI_30060 [Sesbania bispinosa]|nr:hypothetical protein SESBI_30060 [Sesbania bispinosa]
MAFKKNVGGNTMKKKDVEDYILRNEDVYIGSGFEAANWIIVSEKEHEARASYESYFGIFSMKQPRVYLSKPLSHQDRVKAKKALRGIKALSFQDLMATFVRKNNKPWLSVKGLGALPVGSDTKVIYQLMEVCQIKYTV